MRALSAQFEDFGSAQVLAGGLERGNAPGFELARIAEPRRIARKYKNSGNEAKEYLKTKDITFFDAANCAHFTRKFAPN